MGGLRAGACVVPLSTMAEQYVVEQDTANCSAMVESGTTQAPARKPPMKVSR